MGVVVFDAAAFKIRYPEYASMSDGILTAYFGEAELYLSNKDNSAVQDLSARRKLLNMLTAHIAALVNNRPVGSVISAAEGSVSSSFSAPAPGTSEWYAQTQYGLAYWQAVSSYRSARYRPCPTVY